MFDNTKPNVIFLSDFGNQLYLEKTIGPYKVARQLRNAGYEVAVVHHLMAFSVTEIKHILKNLISDQTLFVGVNNFFYKKIVDYDTVELQYPDPHTIIPHGIEYNDEIKQTIKDANPNCKLALGGPNASDIPIYSDFDYIFLGYSEMSIINLAKHLQYPMIDLDKSRISKNGFTVIDDSKAPEYDFVNHTMLYEDHDAILDHETLVVELARGCIFQCKFCSYPLNGKSKLDFIRTEESLYREFMDNYERFGTTNYTISDDTLNDSVEKCEMLANLANRLPFQPMYSAAVRLDLMTARRDTIDMLWQAGLRSAFFGIESMHQEASKFVGKGGKRERLIETLQYIRKQYGGEFNQTGGFILGLPKEPLSSMRETIEWLLSDDNPLDIWQMFPLMIRDTSLVKGGNGFVSDFDKNWEKYGYEDTGIKTSKYYMHGYIPWRNEFTDFNEVSDMVDDAEARMRERGRDRAGNAGRHVLLLASLVAKDSAKIAMSDYNNIDWDQLNVLKLEKSLEYKDKLFKHCGIPHIPREKDYRTFTDFVKSEEYRLINRSSGNIIHNS